MRRWLAACFVFIALSTPLLSADNPAANINKSWLDAYSAADFDRLATLYTDNALLMADGREPREGREAIKKFFADEFKHVPERSVTLRPSRIESSGDLVVESGEYKYDGVDAHGKALHIIGNYSAVLQNVGEWRIALQIWNTRAPGQP